MFTRGWILFFNICGKLICAVQGAWLEWHLVSMKSSRAWFSFKSDWDEEGGWGTNIWEGTSVELTEERWEEEEQEEEDEWQEKRRSLALRKWRLSTACYECREESSLSEKEPCMLKTSFTDKRPCLIMLGGLWIIGIGTVKLSKVDEAEELSAMQIT